MEVTQSPRSSAKAEYEVSRFGSLLASTLVVLSYKIQLDTMYPKRGATRIRKVLELNQDGKSAVSVQLPQYNTQYNHPELRTVLGCRNRLQSGRVPSRLSPGV